MKLTVTVVLLVIVLAMPAFAYDWRTNPSNEHQYTAIECFSWTGAQAQAVALGGYLATISDATENEWVRSELSPMVSGRWAAFIGMYQPNGEIDPNAEWVWVTGEPFIYTNWDPGEPNGGTGENYGLMYIGSGKWNDGQLPWGYAFVEVGPVPEPSSLLALGFGITTLITLKRRKKR